MATQSVAGRLDKHFGKPLGELSPELREIAVAYIPKWSELSAIERKAKAQEADRQRDVKTGLRNRKFTRGNEKVPQRVHLPDGHAMYRKITFWLAPKETHIRADQVPGAIADTLYPPPERNELAGQAPNDPNAGKRHEEERVQSKQLRIKFPHLKDDDKFSIGDLNDYLARHEMVVEIRRRSDVIDNLDPKSRWNNRLFVDGFKSVQYSAPEAKHSRAEASDERCIELANLRELYVDHWIELVGVGLGQHGLYDISAERVKFRKHEDEYISLWPDPLQVDMLRDNRVAPELKFPCTPIEMLHFIDALSDFCDTAIGMHSFILPEAFRGAAATSKRNAIEIPASDEQTVIRKRAALISEVVAFWPSITQDLSDSVRNGLHDCAKHPRHGYWFVEPALGWATQRGKIQKTMAQSFVIENEGSRLTPLLRVLLKLN